MPDAAKAEAAARSIFSLLDLVPSIDVFSNGGKVIQKALGSVRFQNVHFAYPERPSVKVLQGLNVEIKAGAQVALVGASGGGKSTLFALLQRFYSPLAGHIYMDGIDITTLNLASLRRQIGVVSQEVSLVWSHLAPSLASQLMFFFVLLFLFPLANIV
jgi:ATP-binding cassette subfamily B (MDR/TAP) protein 1